MPSAFESPVNDAIDGAILARRANQPRLHLGMSQIGHHDERTAWMQYHWCLEEDFTARTFRIFEMGDVIEELIIRYLRQGNMKVVGQQDRVEFLGGHFSGSCDGIVTGVPSAPITPHLFEAKSANDKEFKQAQKVGIEKWKPTYWTQVHCYMKALGLTRCLFAVYNKNTSELYFERIEVDPMVLPAMIERARRIISLPPPASSYKDRTDYRLKFMSPRNQAIYHGDELPAPNCRNCKHWVANLDAGGQGCKYHRKPLTLDEMKAGCNDAHDFIPELMSEKAKAVADERHWTSRELTALSQVGFDTALRESEVIGDLRGKMGGEVVNAQMVKDVCEAISGDAG